MGTPTASTPSYDPIMDRLEDQIAWYDRKSQINQRYFKRIKVTEIIAAALIPFLSAIKFQYSVLVIAGLGVLITVLEGLLHLNQFQENWTTYRSTCEQLRHEKYLYLGGAAPYSNATDAERRALLADRVESSVSQEHAKWASLQDQAAKGKTG
jgi:uncharacterized protein DUF4231